ncbi:MAG: ABC transporter permease [Chthoniobacteraceae bacterium]
MPVWLNNLLLLAGCGVLVALVRGFLFTERSHRALNRLRRDRVGILCAVMVVFFLLAGLSDCVLINPRQSVLDYAFRNVPREEGYSAPLARATYSERGAKPLRGWHLMGTDLLGKDVLFQTLKGCRTALIIGGLTSAIYLPLGTLLGILGGYFRGWVDDVVQYLFSTMASIPGILLLVAVMMTLGKGLDRMAIALSLTAWIGLCRLVRGETFRQAAKPYVDAARALGQSQSKIILRHILPNVMHLVIINAILGFSGLVLTETILSYLGVGAPVGTASWGTMIDTARMELSREPAVWWPLASASIALFMLVLSLNLLGDSLRRAFDPKAA